MKSPLRLGFMPTRRRFFSKDDALKYKALILKRIRELAPKIEIVDIDWLNDEGLIRDVDESSKVARHFIEKGVDAIFCPHCNFGTEDAVTLAAKKVGKPVLLWGPRDEAPNTAGERLRDSQCGLFATSKVMQRFGVRFTYIVNSRVDTKVFENGFLNFLRAANAVKHFTGARIGQVSTRPRDFYSVIVNEGELMEKFGVQIVPVDLGKIIAEVKSMIASKPTELDAVAEAMRTTADFSRMDKELPLKLAALKMAIQKWSDAEGLGAVAFQCWDALQEELQICSCFAHAELTDDGLPVACETDIHGAMSSLLLQACDHFESPTFFADLTIRHPENDNAELLWHCGPFPASLAEGTRTINSHFVLPSHAEGVCNWKLKSGRVTVSRFDGAGGNYSLFCGEGRTVPGPFNQGTYTYLEVNDWPLWEEKLIYGPYIHHVSCSYGSYSAALYEAARHIENLDFDPVHPALYEIKKALREGREVPLCQQ
ncbi:MAG: L-fucose/L-arabinose isomerase family protein [Spirochaetes bacterium]|nr:L-fucose/L-arabinose isomerase family protein [Spirochaetota bacterium]